MGEDYSKDGKSMIAHEARTIRALVTLANSLKIPREDIVSIVPTDSGYIMIYYR